MKTLLITGGSPIPDAVRNILRRGSTAIEEWRTDESDASAIAAARPDRVVFWETEEGDSVAPLVRECAGRQDLRQAIIFVATQRELAPRSLAPDQVFVWPLDEDRLKMAFLTGG